MLEVESSSPPFTTIESVGSSLSTIGPRPAIPATSPRRVQKHSLIQPIFECCRSGMCVALTVSEEERLRACWATFASVDCDANRIILLTRAPCPDLAHEQLLKSNS